MEGIRVSDDGRAFRVSISFWKDEVKWLLGALWNFYWTKGGKAWGWNKGDRNHNFWVALGRNRKGRFLVLIEEKGKAVRQLFIPEGVQAGGWWRMMVVMFETGLKM